jgi:hypothetical protein
MAKINMSEISMAKIQMFKIIMAKPNIDNYGFIDYG